MAKSEFEEKVLARALTLKEHRRVMKKVEREVSEMEQALALKRGELREAREALERAAAELVGELKV